jgi:hypothetical protein
MRRVVCSPVMTVDHVRFRRSLTSEDFDTTFDLIERIMGFWTTKAWV